MRTLVKNKQVIYYAEMTGRSADTSTDTIVVDGKTVYVDEGDYGISYGMPGYFLANISFSGGDSSEVEFGIDESAYDAVIVTDKGAMPLTETSLVWYETDPPSTESDGSTADYTVVAVRNTLHQTKAILERRVKDGN